MKKIILVILIALSFYNCKAQITGNQTIYPLGTSRGDVSDYHNFYIKDTNNHHNDLVGVWKWQEGNSYFEITLQEFEYISYPLGTNTYYDELYGKYKYVVNGEVISETTEITTLPYFNVNFMFKTPTKYYVIIKDVISETSKVGYFTIISTNTATLKLRNSEGVKVNYGNGQEFALPTNITLIKQ